MKALALCVLLLFAKVLLRRDWLAFVAVVLLANAITIVERPGLLIQVAFEVPAAAAAVWLLIRWGVLPMIVASFIAEWAIHTPLTTDFAAWYSGPTLLLLGTTLIAGNFVVLGRAGGTPAVRTRAVGTHRLTGLTSELAAQPRTANAELVTDDVHGAFEGE